MAEIAAVVREIHPAAVTVTWAGVADGDTLAPVNLTGFESISVQAEGDASAVALEGSLDGITYADLTEDPDDAIVRLAAPVRFLAGEVTGGSDTTVIAYALSTR